MTEYQLQIATDFKKRADEYCAIQFDDLSERVKGIPNAPEEIFRAAANAERLRSIHEFPIGTGSFGQMASAKDALVKLTERLKEVQRTQISQLGGLYPVWSTDIGKRLSELEDAIFRLTASILAHPIGVEFLGKTLAKVERAEFEKLRGQLEEKAALVNALVTSASDQSEKVNTLLNSVQANLEVLSKRMAQYAVREEAEAFTNAVGNHIKGFAAWSTLAFLVLVTLLIYAFWFVAPEWKDIPNNPTGGEIAKHALPKVIIYAVGVYLLIWLFRNAAAERHNWIVNAHRAHALSTFETFHGGTTTQTIKDAILLQASSAVFSPQPSGFLKEEPASQETSRLVTSIAAVAHGKSIAPPTN